MQSIKKFVPLKWWEISMLLAFLFFFYIFYQYNKDSEYRVEMIAQGKGYLICTELADFFVDDVTNIYRSMGDTYQISVPPIKKGENYSVPQNCDMWIYVDNENSFFNKYKP